MENKSNITESLYNLALEKVEELLPLVTNDTPASDPNSIELMHWSEIVEQFEMDNYPINYVKGKAEPTLSIAGKLCKVLKIAPADMLMV